MKWVTIWGNAISTVLPTPQTYAKNLTLRYPIYIPFNGNKLRITLDNFCCDEDVSIEEATVSIGDELSDIYNGEPTYLTVNGNKSFTIKAHNLVKTDQIEYNLLKDKYLIINIYLKDYTKLTSGVDIVGPLSKGYFAYGNQVLNKKLDINTSKSTSWVYYLANVDIYTADDNDAIICYGDSITSQDWPDYLLLHLREANINNLSVVRKAVSGTRILREYSCITYQSYGKSGFNRFNHEISSVAGAKYLIIQHGINDIIHPVGSSVNIFRPLSDLPTAEDLINGLKYYLEEAKKYKLDVYLGTLLPIYNWRTYSAEKEELKNKVNEFIKQNKYIDFEGAVAYKDGNIYKFKEGFNSGDNLHPSKLAYNKMGLLAKKIIIGE